MMKNTHTNLIQAYRQAPWRVQLQIIGVFSFALVMIGLVAGIYLNVTARAATIGREILSLQDETLDIQRVNADLETQVAWLTSASVMEARARALGFRPVSPDQVVYISIPGYFGRQEAVLAPPAGPVASPRQPLPPAFTQSLLDWVSETVQKSHNPLEVRP